MKAVKQVMSSRVQIPRDICSRLLKRYLYSAKSRKLDNNFLGTKTAVLAILMEYRLYGVQAAEA